MDRLEEWEIDALESLVRQYEMSAHDYYSKAYDIEMDSDDAKILEKAIKIIKAIPSAEPSDVLGKIRAEIEKERVEVHTIAFKEEYRNLFDDGRHNGLLKAIEIIDKYREGEES